jgi:hypothetical protein
MRKPPFDDDDDDDDDEFIRCFLVPNGDGCCFLQIIKMTQEAARERAEKDPYKAANLKTAIDSSSKLTFVTFRFCPIANNYDQILQAKQKMIWHLLKYYRILNQQQSDHPQKEEEQEEEKEEEEVSN